MNAACRRPYAYGTEAVKATHSFRQSDFLQLHPSGPAMLLCPAATCNSCRNGVHRNSHQEADVGEHPPRSQEVHVSGERDLAGISQARE